MPPPTLPREIKLGAKGRDVRAYQRALRKAGFRPKGTKTTNEFDAQMDAEVRAFQQAKGLLVDGEIGENTFGQLLPHIDAWGKRLLAAVKKAVPSSIRQKVVASAFVGYQNRDSIRYTQTGQRMQGVRDGIRPPSSRSSRTARRSRPGATGLPAVPIRMVSTTTARAGPGRRSSTASNAAIPRPGDLVFYGPSHSLDQSRRRLRRERQRGQPRPGKRALPLSDRLQPRLEGRPPAGEELPGLTAAGGQWAAGTSGHTPNLTS